MVDANPKLGINPQPVLNYMGFTFASTYQKGVKGRYQLTVGEKAWAKLKQSLKEVTRKTAPRSFEERIRKINDPSR
jgi:RNA-directed DNA polymerase